MVRGNFAVVVVVGVYTGGVPHPEVSVLLSGAQPANPAGVLSSESLVQLLAQLEARFDVVLIDSAPLLSVSDTVPLLRIADSVLLVGRIGYTTRDTAKRLMEFLTRVPDMSLAGVVANDLSKLDAEGYGYGYVYGYYKSRRRNEKIANASAKPLA